MELCAIARVVLLISILGIITDSYLFGISFLSLVANVLMTVLIVWITNWSCYSEGYNWIAWVIVIINVFAFISLMYVIKYKNSEEVKKLIEEEKNNRK